MGSTERIPPSGQSFGSLDDLLLEEFENQFDPEFFNGFFDGLQAQDASGRGSQHQDLKDKTGNDVSPPTPLDLKRPASEKPRDSRYSGVEKNARKGWLAVHCSKYLGPALNTAKEAALVYDAYLQRIDPQNAESLCNFCQWCGLFRNPLGLSGVARECACQNTNTPDGQQISDRGSRSPLSVAAPHVQSPAYSPAPGYTSDEASDGSPDHSPLYVENDFNNTFTLEAIPENDRWTMKETNMVACTGSGSASTTIMVDGTLNANGIAQAADLGVAVAMSSGANTAPHTTPVTVNGSMGLVDNGLSPGYGMFGNGVPVSLPVSTSGMLQSYGDGNLYLSGAHSNEAPMLPTSNGLGWETMLGMTPTAATAESKLQSGVLFDENNRPEIIFSTEFLEKYWRNDRKNIQCFPYCKEHGDYSAMKLNNLSHSAPGVCRAPVLVDVILNTQMIPEKLSLIAVCAESGTEADILDQDFSEINFEELGDNWIIGTIETESEKIEGERRKLRYVFFPSNWKFQKELPKTKRKADSVNVAATLKDPVQSEWSFTFVVLAFYLGEDGKKYLVAFNSSPSFELESTRTLLRHRNKAEQKTSESAPPVEDASSIQLSVVENATGARLFGQKIPDKKKIKMEYGQRARADSVEKVRTPALQQESPQATVPVLMATSPSKLPSKGSLVQVADGACLHYQGFKKGSSDSIHLVDVEAGDDHREVDGMTYASVTNAHWNRRWSQRTLSLAFYGILMKPSLAICMCLAYSALLLISAILCALFVGVYLLAAVMELADLNGRGILHLVKRMTDDEVPTARYERCDPQDLKGTRRLKFLLSDEQLRKKLVYLVLVQVLVAIPVMVATALYLLLAFVTLFVPPLSGKLIEKANDTVLWSCSITKRYLGVDMAGQPLRLQ